METNYLTNVVIAINQLGYIAGWDARIAVWIFAAITVLIFTVAFSRAR